MRGNDAPRSRHDDLVTLYQLLEFLFIILALLIAEVAGRVQNDTARVDLSLKLGDSVTHIF